ncbi:hypothetical protein NHQ30_010768 [Ciborinia camelliae]|nr:hypothetical protein NHQ30_010768 [Ciborinia camelliae]
MKGPDIGIRKGDCISKTFQEIYIFSGNLRATVYPKARDLKPKSTLQRSGEGIHHRKQETLTNISGHEDPETACCMTDLSEIFAELGISQYLQNFKEQGFDSWDTILDITESDFDALGVKLGHRRKLQRRIANSRGLSSDIALASPTGTTPSEIHGDEAKVGGARDAKEGGSGPHGAKRKYRRHPKTDENAPERPPSAYVIFSNKMREDLKGRNLSFTEIAKLVGENWQNLSPSDKEPFEHSAYTAKERYNNELAEYKKTQNFKDYSQYLADFKQKQNQQLATEMDVAKRPKLEAHQSTASSGTASSGGSQTCPEFSLGRMRVDSSASSTSPWNTSTSPSSAVMTPMPNLANLTALTNVPKIPGHQGRLGPGSPIDMPKVLPGYRESILGSAGSPIDIPKVLPGYRESMLGPGAQHLREDHRDGGSIVQPMTLPISSERRISQSSPTTTSAQDHSRLNDSTQHRRTPQSNLNPLPSLTSESTIQSTSPAASNSMYFAPRTPLEPDVNRSLPIPPLYPQKSYDGQLPFFTGPPSLSPQNSFPGTQQSPNVVNPIKDFPTTMPPMRRFSEVPPSISTTMGSTMGRSDIRRSEIRTPDSPHPHLINNYILTAEDNDLDPINALLRAGEIVSRTSREGRS